MVGRKIQLHNNGSPIRNWLHASDTADAVIKIIESGSKNEIYNIAGGFEQSNLDTVRKIIFEYNGEIDLDKFVDFSYIRPGMDVRYALDDSKLRNLGWYPKMKFDEQIPDIVDYYKNKFIW